MEIMLGEKLKELREKKGYKQADVADLVPVSPSGYRGWESGTTIPDTRTLAKLCEIFEVSAWNGEHEIEYIETEQAIWHKQLLYAGTLDLIALVDGVLTLVDYKTTYRINDMLTAVQLEAYLRALESQGKGADGKAILQLRKNGTYCYKEYPAHDLEAWDVFTSLLKIRAYIEKN